MLSMCFVLSPCTGLGGKHTGTVSSPSHSPWKVDAGGAAAIHQAEDIIWVSIKWKRGSTCGTGAGGGCMRLLKGRGPWGSLAFS